MGTLESLFEMDPEREGLLYFTLLLEAQEALSFLVARRTWLLWVRVSVGVGVIGVQEFGEDGFRLLYFILCT